MPATAFPRIIQLQDGTYATPDGHGGWAPYTGALPNGQQAGGGPEPFKVGDSDAIAHAWDVVSSINDSKKLANAPLATGTASASLTSVPVIGGIVGQNRADLQTKLGQVAGELRQLGIRSLYQQTGQKGVGSVARNQAEQQALQSSLAPLGYVDTGGHTQTGGAQPSPEALIGGLNTAQSIFYRHLARLYGLNPDDPATLHTLDAASKDPNVRQTLLTQAQQAAIQAQKGGGVTPPPNNNVPDSGITKSNPPPPLSVLDNSAAPSSEKEASVDQNVLRIKPQLERMLAQDPSKVSNADILAYMQQNGVDPSRTSINAALNYRMSSEGAKWRQRGGNYAVDPTVNVPMTGAKRFFAKIANAQPGGVPVGATLVGAGDVATLGAAPDIAGVVHSVTGAGPTRQDVINARDVSAQAHPYATFAGNIGGGLINPVFRSGGLGRTALTSAGYGFLGSEDPSLTGRLENAALASIIGSIVHTGASAATKGVQSGYRGVAGMFNPDAAALSHAADSMPAQDIPAATEELAGLRALGINPPAAAVLNRGGQDFLAKVASSSPAARTVADKAVSDFYRNVPDILGHHFDQAIADAAPDGVDASAYLSRPTREIASDVQNMAGNEYETGMRPIANEPLHVTPDLQETLTHERIGAAIKDALANHQLDAATRAELRNLPAQLKNIGKEPEGIPQNISQAARDAIIAQLPKQELNLSVNGARNIATALDRTASKLQEGTEGQIQLRALSRDIRGGIANQYPEFGSINQRYASRMSAIDAMDSARRLYLGESPEQIDALAKASKDFTDTANPTQFRGEALEPNGAPQPSNRQFAMAGAREAATTSAGAGTGKSGPNLLDQIANGPNQAARNAMVLGPQAEGLAQRAGASAKVADAVSRATTTTGGDASTNMWKAIKRAVATKMTGGVSHYAVGSAIASIPGLTGADAARVSRIFLEANSADQALNALNRSYNAAKARAIFSRVMAMGTVPAYTRGTPTNQPPIGAPVH